MSHDVSILRRTSGMLDFANPLVFGGGCCKTLEEVKRACDSGVGGIDWGTITKLPKAGNPGPNVFYAHWVNGVLVYTLNSLGLINPGWDYVARHADEALEYAHERDVRLGVNIAADRAEDVAELLEATLTMGFDWITINGGCPNKYHEGKPVGTFCYDRGEVEFLVQILDAEFKGISTQIWWKPGMFSDTAGGLPDHVRLINESKVITGYIANNTFGHCFAWSEDGKPVISPANGLAGMGGPAVKPIAEGHLRMIKDRLSDTITPLAAGGATTGSDVADYLRHGARLVHATSIVWANPRPNGLGYDQAGRMLSELLEVEELPSLMAL